MSINLGSNIKVQTTLPLDAKYLAADLTARDAIAAGERYEGMQVYVVADGTTYQLVGGITNSDWTTFGAGGGGGGINSGWSQFPAAAGGFSNATTSFVTANNALWTPTVGDLCTAPTTAGDIGFKANLDPGTYKITAFGDFFAFASGGSGSAKFRIWDGTNESTYANGTCAASGDYGHCNTVVGVFTYASAGTVEFLLQGAGDGSHGSAYVGENPALMIIEKIPAGSGATGATGATGAAGANGTNGTNGADGASAILGNTGTRASATAITTSGISWSVTPGGRQVWYVAGSGGPVAVTSDPCISSGAVSNNELYIIGTDATNTVTLQSDTGVVLKNGPWVGGLNDVLCLLWDNDNHVWVEEFRAPRKSNVQAKTTTYSIANTDDVITVDGTTAFTTTLPTAVGIKGKEFTIVRIDQTLAHAVTLATTSSQVFLDNGATTKKLMTQGEQFTVVSNGSDWIVRSHTYPSIPIGYTPTGTWTTNTTYTGKWKRDGSFAEITIHISLAGAPTSATLTANVPSGLTMDTSQLAGAVANVTPVGFGGGQDISASDKYDLDVAYSTTTAVVVSYKTANGASPAQIRYAFGVTQAAPVTWASGDTLDLNFKVPITNWEG